MSDTWDHEADAWDQLMETDGPWGDGGDCGCSSYHDYSRRKILKDIEIIARSVKALFVRAGKKQTWIPKSQVIEINEDTIVITQWMQDRLKWEKFEPLFPPQKLTDRIKDLLSGSG